MCNGVDDGYSEGHVVSKIQNDIVIIGCGDTQLTKALLRALDLNRIIIVEDEPREIEPLIFSIKNRVSHPQEILALHKDNNADRCGYSTRIKKKP